LKDAQLTIEVRAGEGRIYGSVGNRDIAEALKGTYDVDVDRRKLLMGEPIKTTGDHEIEYRPHPEVSIPVKVSGVAEIGSAATRPTAGNVRRVRAVPPGPARCRRLSWRSAVPDLPLRPAVPLDAYQVGGAAYAERDACRDDEAVARITQLLLGDRAVGDLDHLVGVVDVIHHGAHDAPRHG